MNTNQIYLLCLERMSKPKFIKEIEKLEGKERAECGRWYIRVYGELDHKPMVELESLEIVVKELHKLEKENKKLKEELSEITMVADDEKQSIEHILELEEENKKLKAELELKNLALKQAQEGSILI